MKIEDSVIASQYLKKLEIPFGNFYIFEKFVVGEVHDGVSFSYKDANILLNAVENYFGKDDLEMSYISNRVNSYSVYPLDWLKFYNSKYTNKLKKVAYVSYTKVSATNVILESFYLTKKTKRFTSLDEAVIWVNED